MDPKIEDRDLLDFVLSGDEEATREVIVELVRVAKEAPPAHFTRRPLGRAPSIARATTAPTPARDDDLDALAEQLHRLQLTEVPMRIPIAEAFTLTATPSVLRRIAALPLVGIIRPNRTHSRKRA